MGPKWSENRHVQRCVLLTTHGGKPVFDAALTIRNVNILPGNRSNRARSNRLLGNRGRGVAYSATRVYLARMIQSFRHKGLRRFYETGSASGIQAAHAARIRMQFAALDTAQNIQDMDIPGYRLHALKGKLKGRWSIWVNGNWRLTFEFRNGDAYLLDYEDYH